LSRSLELAHKIENSIGFQARKRKVILKTFFDIYHDNFKDILLSIKEKEDLWTSGQLDYRKNLEVLGEDAFDIEGRDWLHTHIYKDILRKLHNYLAACFSLRDCTKNRIRSFLIDYSDMSEYKERIDLTFTNNPIRAFLQNLRNNWIHQGGPFPVYRAGFYRVDLDTDGESETERRCEISFDAKQLLKDYQWKSLAKSYISSWNKTKKFNEIIEEYNQIVESYYEWLLEFYDSIFREEYRRTDELRKERLDIIRNFKI